MGSGEPTVLQPPEEPHITESASWVRPVVWLVAAGLMVLPLLTRSSSPTFLGADEQAIREVLFQQQVAWNGGDLEGFFEHYAKSSRLVMASGNEVATGWQGVLDRYRQTYGSPEQMGELRLHVLQVERLGRAYAKALGRWQLAREDTTTAQGLFTVILKREPDGWMVIHDHTSQEETP